MAERGFPLTTNMARAFAWAVSLSSQAHFNEESRPGKHWWQKFRARHPELSLRTADNLERSQANAMTREVVDDYFACLKTTLEENRLVHTPRQIFNCNETFLPLNIACKKGLPVKIVNMSMHSHIVFPITSLFCVVPRRQGLLFHP